MKNRTVVMNARRMNYDGSLDFSCLSPNLTIYDDTALEEFLSRIQDAGIVVTKELPVPAELIAQFPDSVKLICEAGTGYNNIALDAARARGISVCNVPAYSTQRVAHLAVCLMLNLASSMHTQIRMLHDGDRSNFTQHLMVPHVEVNGKTLGIIGAGSIGRNVIKIARALDMNVLVYTRTPKEDSPSVTHCSLEHLLSNSDFVSLHCPLTTQTRHITNAETLAMMKPSACLINTSRGALVDEPALIEALRSGVIAGAGLDVQETEPPAQDNPLYTLENVILTPHIGWKGQETRQRLVSIVADNIHAFLNGSPINVVN